MAAITIVLLLTHMTALAVNKKQQRALHADKGAIRFCHNHRKAVVFCTWRRLEGIRLRLHHARPHQLARPPHYDAWLCIHHGEGAWNSNTGNGYYGGLQMDTGFQQAYGIEFYRSKGTADHWTPLEQMWVAERAYRSRGFNPWPNTARRCGLL